MMQLLVCKIYFFIYSFDFIFFFLILDQHGHISREFGQVFGSAI